MAERQHGKGKKRRSGWHRGKKAGRQWEKAAKRLPDTGVEVDAYGEPVALVRELGPRRRRGESI